MTEVSSLELGLITGTGTGSTAETDLYDEYGVPTSTLICGIQETGSIQLNTRNSEMVLSSGYQDPLQLSTLSSSLQHLGHYSSPTASLNQSAPSQSIMQLTGGRQGHRTSSTAVPLGNRNQSHNHDQTDSAFSITAEPPNQNLHPEHNSRSAHSKEIEVQPEDDHDLVMFHHSSHENRFSDGLSHNLARTQPPTQSSASLDIQVPGSGNDPQPGQQQHKVFHAPSNHIDDPTKRSNYHSALAHGARVSPTGHNMTVVSMEESNEVRPVIHAAEHKSLVAPIQAAAEHPVTVSTAAAAAAVAHVPHSSSAGIHFSGAYSRQKRVDNALTSKRQENFEKEPDHPAVQLASQCLHANDYSKMVEVLFHVLSTVAVHFGLGLAYYKMRRFPSAVKHFMKMEDMAYMDNHQRGNVYLSLYYRGEISFSKQNYLEAADLFHKSVSVYSSDTVAVRYRITPPSKSVVYAKEGASFRHAQRILEAVRAYKNAISVAESRRDKLSACTSLGNMYQSLGENVSALAQYETTIKLAKELGDHVSLGWAHGNMGNAYLGLQQKDKALHHLKEALELAVKYETTPQAIGRTYNNLGTAYQSMNDLDKAEEYYDLALSQAVYGNDAGGQARVYGNFGNVLMLKKEYDRAIVHYTEAYNLSNDRATKTTALHNRGCASYEKGEANKKKYLTGEGAGSSNITYDGANMKDSQYHRPDLPESVLKSYRNGHKDLAKVIERHEESFQTIKGSTHGLTLSVSLFESNSRTFHRVQDCLFSLGEFQKALEFAEQSRTRSLGELMFERCGKYQQNPLCSPMNIDQIFSIIKSLKSEKVDVVYISYTGARIIVWVISPINSHVEINLFQASLQDDQFEGKSLDYFLRYSLNELLIENHVELYSFCDYEKASEAKHLSTLNEIFGKPLLTILEAVRGRRSIYDIILITDSYTHLMPVPTLFDRLSHQFLGDRLRVRCMPSLLTMGIMVKMPKVVVEVSEESQKFCIVGNPTIPMFQYQGESWRLGKLPFATKEAEWVAHILKTTPTLHEQATKMIILSMINSAKVVHLATHGSATAGFLAFAGLGSSRTREVTDEKTVLLYPEEVEKLHISPALVVLSSCDSGRGTVKADGIQGMARAFILAGAQSVLTTLWRIHDESASTFMKFFYQYLMDGFRSSVALHKASLSVRCFAKYSHYVHWSGYQLTGREIQLNVHMSSKDQAVLTKVGITPSFPRLDTVKKLEAAFLKDPATPTDVQLVHGYHGLKPSEPVIDFIKKHHTHFTGGVFFVSGAAPELIDAAERKIKQVLSGIFPLKPPIASTPHIIIIFDNISTIPRSSFFTSLLKNTNTHIVITFNATSTPKDLVRMIDRELIRGTNIIELKPLSSLLTTQRLIHSIMKGCDTDDFIPYNEEQKMLSLISEHTGGSPDVIDLTSTVLAERLSKGDVEQRRSTLQEFCVESIVIGESERKEDAPKLAKMEERVTSDSASVSVVSTESVARNSQSEEKLLNPNTVVTYTTNVVKSLDFPQSDYFLLKALHWFGPVPIPRDLIEILQSIIMSASKHQRPSKTPIVNLLSSKLLRVYPSTIIVKPASSQLPYSTNDATLSSTIDSTATTFITDSDFYYVPQLVIDSVQSQLQPMDKDFSLTAAFKALSHYSKESNCDLIHTAGLANVLSSKVDEQNAFFQEIYRLYVSLVTRTNN